MAFGDDELLVGFANRHVLTYGLLVDADRTALRQFRNVHLRQRFVDIHVSEIYSHGATKLKQSGLRVNERLQEFVLVLRFLTCASDNRQNTGHDERVCGIAAKGNCTLLDVACEGACGLQIALDGKDHLSVFGCEISAVFGRSSLYENRVALWAARQRQRSAHLEIFALVIQHA